MTDEPIHETPPPDFALLLPFDTDDPEFARGFEAGRVWSFLQPQEDDDLPLSFTMHAANAEMAMRIAESVGFVARSETLDDNWIEVTFEARADN